MKLTPFIEGLFQTGSVLVEGQITAFEEADLKLAAAVLTRCHESQKIEMPFSAPAFDEEAALWAAQYFYNAIQLVMLRDLGEEAIAMNLLPYTRETTSDAIYSVDLTFRYFPDLFNLAKGLAPDDPLVNHLKIEAARWPFSSVGVKTSAEINTTVILSDPSLRFAYMDRIIKAKHNERLDKPELQELAKEVLGEHAELLWQNVELNFKNEIINDN